MNPRIVGESTFLDDEAVEVHGLNCEDQEFEDEAQSMMCSWDKDLIQKEVQDEQAIHDHKRDIDFARYYDGTKSVEELKEEMDELSQFVHIKVIESVPDGKPILASQTILFDRIGFFEYNPIPWESSIYDGKPTLLNLADDPIIPGLVQAILSLRQGERANVLIHPALAYGRMGVPPLIPRDAYIYYNIKIYKAWDESDLECMLRYERSESLFVPLKDKMEIARQHKDAANQYLRDNQPREALVRYKAAIKWIRENPAEELEGSAECKELMKVLYLNTALTLNKLEMYKSATKAAKMAQSIDPSDEKASYHLAKARIGLGDHSRALDILDQATKMHPNSLSLKYLRAQIDLNLKDEKTKRDEILHKMSRGCSL